MFCSVLCTTKISATKRLEHHLTIQQVDGKSKLEYIFRTRAKQQEQECKEKEIMKKKKIMNKKKNKY